MGKQRRLRPDAALHTPNTAFDQGLHYLLTECSKTEKYHPTTLKIEMDWVQTNYKYYQQTTLGGNGFRTSQVQVGIFYWNLYVLKAFY